MLMPRILLPDLRRPSGRSARFGSTVGAAGLLLLALAAEPVQAQSPTGMPADFSDYLPGGMGPNSADINCTIKPLQMVDISSQVRGIAKEVLVRPGQLVEPGQPLVALDTEIAAAEARLAEAKAEADATLQSTIINRDGLKTKTERLKKAMEKKAVSVADYEAAALELALATNAVHREEQLLRVARLEYEKTKLLIDKSTIRSPVKGMVGENLIDPGESVSDKPIATIFVTQPKRVEAFIPAQKLAKVLDQETFAIQIDGREGAAVPVELDYVSQLADLTSNTVSAFFTLTADDVLPGSKCRLVQGVEPPSEPNE